MVEEYKVIPVGRAKDIRGQKFNRLTVVDRVEKPSGSKNSDCFFSCLCECGNLIRVPAGDLKRGNTKSCGCLRGDLDYKGGLKLDLSNQTFGRLKAVKPVRSVKKSPGVSWLVKCSCGNKTTVKSSSLVSGHTKSCGCLHADSMQVLSGENSARYNPLLTNEERMHKRKPFQNAVGIWRKAVFERDIYTCQSCKDDSGGNLNAHHLNGWNWAKEQRFDVVNGVTLCESCHKEYHSEYGYGDNTVRQFEEWTEKVGGLVGEV